MNSEGTHISAFPQEEKKPFVRQLSAHLYPPKKDMDFEMVNEQYLVSFSQHDDPIENSPSSHGTL